MLIKIAHIILAALFVISTSGFTVSVHYCEGLLYSISLFGEAKDCEQEHGHMKGNKMGNSDSKMDSNDMNMPGNKMDDQTGKMKHNHCKDNSYEIKKIEEDYLHHNNIFTFSNNYLVKLHILSPFTSHSLLINALDNRPQNIQFESPPPWDTKPVLALIQSFLL